MKKPSTLSLRGDSTYFSKNLPKKENILNNDNNNNNNNNSNKSTPRDSIGHTHTHKHD